MRICRAGRDDPHVRRLESRKTLGERVPPTTSPVPERPENQRWLAEIVIAWQCASLLLGPVWWPHEPGRTRR
jgi:hypothetical protein